MGEQNKKQLFLEGKKKQEENNLVTSIVSTPHLKMKVVEWTAVQRRPWNNNLCAKDNFQKHEWEIN